MKNKYFKKTITWLPRILAMLFILFFLLFSFDESIFSIGFLMHNIPTLILMAALAISWKKPFIGGIIYLAIAIITIFFFDTYEHILSFLLITLLPTIIGGLFITDNYIPKK